MTTAHAKEKESPSTHINAHKADSRDHKKDRANLDAITNPQLRDEVYAAREVYRKTIAELGRKYDNSAADLKLAEAFVE